MPDPLITLTTDFGEDSPYVAAMKGIILSINPAARLLDLSHAIPPQDIPHTAWFTSSALPWFPADTIHVVVVDPGVGTRRELLYIECCGQRILAPDNGCWTWLDQKKKPTVRRLRERRWWLPTVSATFHGRDILAPVAAQLSLGIEPALLGPKTTRWTQLKQETPFCRPGRVLGSVVFVDRFGNLITNVPAAAVGQPPEELTVGANPIADFRWVRTYGEAQRGEVVALFGSTGHLEVAVVEGSAGALFAAKFGTAVSVGWTPSISRKRSSG
jgi:S-adenosylmethionine hydrolase